MPPDWLTDKVDVNAALVSKENEYPVSGPMSIFPAVKFEPLMANELGPTVELTQTFPKDGSVLITESKGVVTDPHATNVEELFLGFGVATSKSEKLLLVSVQPLFFRMAAFVDESADTATLSDSLADPYPTKSMTVPAG